MYDSEEFRILTEKFGNYSSWAVWDYKEESDNVIIQKDISCLNTKFVLLGLNISATLSNKPWNNFHGGKNDRKLKYACNDNKLHGSYITDIFKDVPQPNTADFNRFIRNNPDKVSESVSFFNQEMEDVKLSSNSNFIVLGVDTLYYFNKHFSESFMNKVISYKHYSCWGSDKNWVEGFWKELNIRQDFDSTKKNYKYS